MDGSPRNPHTPRPKLFVQCSPAPATGDARLWQTWMLLLLEAWGSTPTLNCFTLAFTISHAAASACSKSPSFDVTATTMFFSGMNTTSAYHIVFDPLCQYTVYGISSLGSFLTQPHA